MHSVKGQRSYHTALELCLFAYSGRGRGENTYLLIALVQNISEPRVTVCPSHPCFGISNPKATRNPSADTMISASNLGNTHFNLRQIPVQDISVLASQKSLDKLLLTYILDLAKYRHKVVQMHRHTRRPT